MDKDTKTLMGATLITTGSLIAYEGYNIPKASKAEMEATRGGAFNVSTVLGAIIFIGGLYLLFKKD